MCGGARTHTCTHILTLAYTNGKEGAPREWGVKSESIMIVTQKSVVKARTSAHVYNLKDTGFPVDATGAVNSS